MYLKRYLAKNIFEEIFGAKYNFGTKSVDFINDLSKSFIKLDLPYH